VKTAPSIIVNGLSLSDKRGFAGHPRAKKEKGLPLQETRQVEQTLVHRTLSRFFSASIMQKIIIISELLISAKRRKVTF
jgi:hypothetical protein